MKLPLNEKTAGVIVIILHIVGIMGYQLDFTRSWFLFLTPFNLIMVFAFWGILLKSERKLFIVFGLIFMIGFVAELLGANFGIIFGDYAYGTSLGIKLWGVPIMIGINWIILTLATAAVVNGLLPSIHPGLKAIFGASLMVALDFVIEPVAMQYNYWGWRDGTIPMSNYVGWFVISFFVQIIVQFNSRLVKDAEVYGVYVFVSQVLFFGILNII